MAQSVLVEIEWPSDQQKFQFVPVLNDRLQELLDRQDRGGKLSPWEPRKAQALTDLADMLSLMKLRSRRTVGRPAP